MFDIRRHLGEIYRDYYQRKCVIWLLRNECEFLYYPSESEGYTQICTSFVKVIWHTSEGNNFFITHSMPFYHLRIIQETDRFPCDGRLRWRPEQWFYDVTGEKIRELAQQQSLLGKSDMCTSAHIENMSPLIFNHMGNKCTYLLASSCILSAYIRFMQSQRIEKEINYDE